MDSHTFCIQGNIRREETLVIPWKIEETSQICPQMCFLHLIKHVLSGFEEYRKVETNICIKIVICTCHSTSPVILISKFITMFRPHMVVTRAFLPSAHLNTSKENRRLEKCSVQKAERGSRGLKRCGTQEARPPRILMVFNADQITPVAILTHWDCVHSRTKY